MTSPENDTRSGRQERALPGREAEAVAEIAATRVARATAWILTLGLLAMLAAGPVAEWLYTAPREAGRTAFRLEVPGAREILASARAAGPRAANRLLRAGIASLDEWAQRETSFVHLVLPGAQRLLLAAGYGNSQTRVAADHWLFYEAELATLSGPGFLEPRRLAERARSVAHPDPLPALLAFARDLAARGIGLLVVPAPSKASVETARLTERPWTGAPIQNPSFDEFLRRLAEAGVPALDGTSLLAGRAARGEPQFLRTDSHWRPEAVETMAGAIAAELRARWSLEPLAGFHLTRRTEPARGRPDLVRLLGLPLAGEGPLDETVTLHVVLGADGRPFDGRLPEARVLLLGDSFAAIYDWGPPQGTGGGLAQQLAFALGQPVDWIVDFAGTAHPAREDLAERLARGEDRLAGKRVVVLEFVARDLADADWPIVPLAPGSSPRHGGAP